MEIQLQRREGGIDMSRAIVRMHLPAALLLGLAICLFPASSQAQGYDSTLNLDGIADGTAYEQPQITSTWGLSGNIRFNYDAQGPSPSTFVVSAGSSGASPCKGGVHKCIEYVIPASSVGNRWSTYRTMGYLLQSPPETILNLEWDLMLETGFDIHGIGKVPFSLGIWDDRAKRFQTLRTNWQCSGRHTATTCSTGKTVWVNYLQNDATGGHDGCVSTKGTTAISTNTWYHFHQQTDLTDPTHPVDRIWIQGPNDPSPVLVFNSAWTPPSGTVDTSHNIQIAHNSWFGGAGNNDRAQNTSYSLEANVHVYTGAPQ